MNVQGGDAFSTLLQHAQRRVNSSEILWISPEIKAIDASSDPDIKETMMSLDVSSSKDFLRFALVEISSPECQIADMSLSYAGLSKSKRILISAPAEKRER